MSLQATDILRPISFNSINQSNHSSYLNSGNQGAQIKMNGVGSFSMITNKNKIWLERPVISSSPKARKVKTGAVIIYPVMKECAALTTDPFWIQICQNAAIGKFPMYFHAKKSDDNHMILNYRKGASSKQNGSVELSHLPVEALSQMKLFMMKMAGIQSDLDKVMMDPSTFSVDLSNQISLISSIRGINMDPANSHFNSTGSYDPVAANQSQFQDQSMTQLTIGPLNDYRTSTLPLEKVLVQSEKLREPVHQVTWAMVKSRKTRMLLIDDYVKQLTKYLHLSDKEETQLTNLLKVSIVQKQIDNTDVILVDGAIVQIQGLQMIVPQTISNSPTQDGEVQPSEKAIKAPIILSKSDDLNVLLESPLISNHLSFDCEEHSQLEKVTERDSHMIERKFILINQKPLKITRGKIAKGKPSKRQLIGKAQFNQEWSKYSERLNKVHQKSQSEKPTLEIIEEIQDIESKRRPLDDESFRMLEAPTTSMFSEISS